VTDTGYRSRRIDAEGRRYLPTEVIEQDAGPTGLPVLDLHLHDHQFLTDDDGRLTTGALLGAFDSVGGLACGLAVLPRWIVTTNLTLRRSPGALHGSGGTGPVRIRSEVLRAGRSAAVAQLTASDERGEAVATGWITSAALTPEEGPPDHVRPFHRVLHPLDDDPSACPRLEEFVGVGAGADPTEGWLEVTEPRRNLWGILLGAGVAVLIEHTALGVVAGVPVGQPTPDHVVSDAIIHYFSPGRVGPVAATATTIGGRGREAIVKVDLRDTGADDRPLTTAVVTVRRVERAA
jgi:acyl-coenzyme A thioesterase PaaI-like protein